MPRTEELESRPDDAATTALDHRVCGKSVHDELPPASLVARAPAATTGAARGSGGEEWRR
jgi:hypothetical protein